MEKLNFESFGLTPTETKIYTEVAHLGEIKIGDLIKRTELHRGTVYNVILRLVEKGFLSFIIKSGCKWYTVTGKKIFQEKLKKEELDIKSKILDVEKFFEHVEEISKDKENADVKIYYGVESFKNLFLEMYDTCKKQKIEYLFMGKGGEMAKATGMGFYEYTQKLKKKLGIICRVLIDRQAKKLEFHKSMQGNRKYLETNTDSPINFWIYDNTTFIVLFESKPLVSIKIQSKTLSDAFRNYFETIWRTTK